MTAEGERAVAWILAREKAGADRREPWEGGLALLSPSLPQVWDASYIRLDRDQGFDAPALAAAADRVLGATGLQHRTVVVPSEATGRALEPGFAPMGWRTERLVVMALRGTPRRRPGAPRAEEVSRHEIAGLRRRMVLSEPWGTPEVAEQLAERDKRIVRSVEARWFAVRAGREPVASCALWSSGDAAEIDDVGTLVEHRGAGMARALVTAAAGAARAAGRERVLIAALLDDWPRGLYARLGFEPVAVLRRFRLHHSFTARSPSGNT